MRLNFRIVQHDLALTSLSVTPRNRSLPWLVPHPAPGAPPKRPGLFFCGGDFVPALAAISRFLASLKAGMCRTAAWQRRMDSPTVRIFLIAAGRLAAASIAVFACGLSPARATELPQPLLSNLPHGDAAAQLTLRKCISPEGNIGYQSAPCASSWRELWSRQENNERVPSLPAQYLAVPTPRAGIAVRARGVASREGSRQRCDAARSAVARKRDREWNRLKFDDLSRLDAWVADQCR